MLKSSMKNKVLVSSFLIIIVSSFVPYLGRSTTGESLPPHFHSPTLESWINGTWQNEFEKFRDRNFGFRNSWVRCKNFIYYMLNFGQFHSSYNGSIYQGRSGFLFERYYLTNQFNWSNSDLNFNWLHFNLNKVSELKLQLSNYDVTLFFNLFPNKASQLQSQWPFLWDLQKKYNPSPIDYYSVWQTAAQSKSIPTFNMQSFFNQSHENDAYYFSKSGTHWSLAMASSAIEPFSESLKNKLEFPYPYLLLKVGMLTPGSCIEKMI